MSNAAEEREWEDYPEPCDDVPDDGIISTADIAELRRRASVNAAPCRAYETGLLSALMVCFAGAFCAALLAVGVLPDLRGPREFLFLDVALLPLTACILVAGLLRLRRWARPVLYFDEHGFRPEGVRRTIPWLHLDSQSPLHENASYMSPGFSFELTLHEEYRDQYRDLATAPLAARCARVSYDAATGTFRFRLRPLRAPIRTCADFYDAFHRPWFAAYARRDLDRIAERVRR